MPHPLIPATLLALALPALAAVDSGVGSREAGREAKFEAGPGAGGVEGGQVTTMSFHERIIVRVPRVGPPPPQIAWKEKHGPRCIAANELAGALVSAPGAVDLVMNGNRRIRAILDDRCEPLDFYSGFYLKPSADGKVCAGRDAIHVRSGPACGIDAFRTLKPVAVKR